MPSVTVKRDIQAPPGNVFDVITHVEKFSKAVPDIVRVEYLSDVREGVGTRFRETRMMNGREATNELRVTEYVMNERVRIVSDAGGTTWDSVFKVQPWQTGTRLVLKMHAKPHKIFARITIPLVMGIVLKALEEDMDAVKAYCEAGVTGAGVR